MNDNRFFDVISSTPGSIFLLGACPALAATANLKSGLTLGIAALILLIITGLLAVALKGVLKSGFRLPVMLLFALALCSAFSMTLHAFLPDVFETLGLYVPLMAIAAAFFAVAQCEAELSIGAAAANILKAGFAYLFAIVFSAAVCEFFGTGSIWGIDAGVMNSMKNAVLTKPAGQILVYGLAAALFSRLFWINKEEEK